MIKVYGMKVCPYCEYIKPQLDERFIYCDVAESTANLLAFVELREKDPAFAECKAIGDLGLPCFVKEDGSVSLKPEDFGLVEYSGSSSCSLANRGHC